MNAKIMKQINESLSMMMDAKVRHPDYDLPNIFVKVNEGDSEATVIPVNIDVGDEYGINGEWTLPGKRIRDNVIRYILGIIAISTMNFSKLKKEQYSRALSEALNQANGRRMEIKNLCKDMLKKKLPKSEGIFIVNSAFTYNPLPEGVDVMKEKLKLDRRRGHALAVMLKEKCGQMSAIIQEYAMSNGALMLGERHEMIGGVKGAIPDVLNSYQFETEGLSHDEWIEYLKQRM